jgi:hypothetical protein
MSDQRITLFTAPSPVAPADYETYASVEVYIWDENESYFREEAEAFHLDIIAVGLSHHGAHAQVWLGGGNDDIATFLETFYREDLEVAYRAL